MPTEHPLRLWLLLLLGCFLSLGATTEKPEPRDLETLMQRLAESRGVEARYREEKRLPLLSEPLVTEGIFYFVPPDRLVRFVERPETASMLLAGDRLRIEDSLGVQDIDLSAEPTARQLVSQLLVLLRGDLDALRVDYGVEFEAHNPGWSLRLKTRDLRARQLIQRIEMNGSGDRLDSMVMYGSQGEETRTEYSNVVSDRQFDAEALAALFPSEGAPAPPPSPTP